MKIQRYQTSETECHRDMPQSKKNSKKSGSKEPLVDESPGASSTKSKSNKSSLIGNLFSKGKSKNKHVAPTENNSPSLTCIYANSNVSVPSSANVSTVGEVSNVSEDGSKMLHKVEQNRSLGKVKKGKLIGILKRKPAEQLPKNESANKMSFHDEICQSSNERVTYEKSHSEINDCSILCCISPDIPLITVLNEVVRFGARLQDSEYHLIQIFSRYLKNENLERELIDAVSGHAKLQIQIERRGQALASTMWKQQIDLYKNQEKTLSANLKEMVWQNRKLQEENELLMKRMDTANVQNEMSSEGTSPNIIDRLHRSNERLRNKLSDCTQQLNELENNLLNEKSRCGTLEEQFSTCFSELQTEKANIQALKMDHQLEMTSIRQQLDSKDEIIKNAIQTGDALLDKIEKTKQGMPSLFDSMHWKGQNDTANPLSNIMMMSNLCIGTAVDKILLLQEEIRASQTERDFFKDESIRFQNTLKATSEEVVALAKQTDLLNAAIHEKEGLLMRINEVEKEKLALQVELKSKVLQLQEINAEKVFIVQGIHQVKSIVLAKDDELKCIKAENETLIFQNKSLSQILMQSGSGDVARELASSQEKLQLMQSHYYQLVANKEQMEEKLRLCTNELEMLKTSNTELTDKFNIQAQNVAELNEIKLKMKEEMTSQQATLTALQNERRRHLAEKNFLRSIYDKIQNEATKTQTLEGSLSEVSKEADRLAMIAEFNKQLGERYQNEIQERDAIIKELKENVRNLNNVQQLNVKEKAALCEELTEMCSIKEILTSKLEMEVRKSVYIKESAKETETNVTQELNALREMQKVEKSAVKELLEDFNTLVTQRDNLLKYKADSEKQIEHLQEQIGKYQEEIKTRVQETIEKEQAIIWLDKQLRTSDESTRRLTDKVGCALKKQIADMDRLVNENSKLTSEQEKYQASIEYLKSNIHNLQSSLDHSRRNENEYKKLLEKETEKGQTLSEELKENSAKNLVITEELVALREHVSELKKNYDNLFTKHQDLIKSTSGYDDTLVRCKSMERMVDEYQEEVKILKEKISNQAIKIKLLEEDNHKQQQLIDELNAEDIKLRGDLLEVVGEKEVINNKLLMVSSELDKVRYELADKIELLEDKTKNQQHMEDTCENAQKHIKDLMDTLHNANEKNVKFKSKFDMVQSMYRTLEDTHRKLAEKLLKTVHSLMNERIARRTAETNSDQLTKRIATIELEKNDFLQKIKTQSDAIKNHERKYTDIEEYKAELEEKLKEALNNYNEILSKYEEVIREFAATEIKCKEYEVRLDNYLSSCPNCKNMEAKISNLKSSLNNSQENVVELEDAINTLRLNITALEFEKTESQLHIYNVQKQLEVERALKTKSQETSNRILTKTLELKEETRISQSACDILLSSVQSGA